MERASLEPRVSSAVRFILILVLLAFLLCCIFDPADRLFGLKVYLFVLSWVAAFFAIAVEPPGRGIHAGLLTYILIFMTIPVASVAWYWVIDGSEPFAGWQLLKAYLLITLALLLLITRINLLPYLAAALSLLAVTIIITFIALTFLPDFYPALYLFGMQTGIVLVDTRDYGAGLVLLQVYFVTSPMLAVAIAHYYCRARTAVTASTKVWYVLLVLLNITGMFLAGTRNNIAVSILLPATLWFYFSRQKLIGALAGTGLAVFLGGLFSYELGVLLDPREASNMTKLSLLQDYSGLFSDATSILLGRGLGAYQFWPTKGTYFFVSELTYLELFRNFGIVGGMVMLILLLFPVLHTLAFRRTASNQHLVIAYVFYLIICISNPNMFSSMGIVILSVLLANLYLAQSPMPPTPAVQS